MADEVLIHSGKFYDRPYTPEQDVEFQHLWKVMDDVKELYKLGVISLEEAIAAIPISGGEDLDATLTIGNDGGGQDIVNVAGLQDSSSVRSIDIENRQLVSATGLVWTIDWDDRLAADSTGQPSIDWEDRLLLDSTLATMFDWENFSFPSLSGGGNQIVTVDNTGAIGATPLPASFVASVNDDGLGVVEVDNSTPTAPIVGMTRVVYPIDATTAAITHTGTLAETLMYNYPIPAGELLSNSILEIMYMGRKTTGAASTHTLRLYLNNVATIGGAGSVLLINNAQSLTTFLGEDRVKWLNSDTSIACKPATNAAWGGATSAVPILSSMDRTAIVYVQLTMQLTVAADVFTLYWVEVNHFKNSI